jgi:LmbE family N-acetylglucosaminyl deacetylase
MRARLVVLAFTFGLALLGAPWSAPAQSPPASDLAPPAPRPDERFKADILLVTAHPDDDTLVASYLAKAIYDERRRVAVVVCTDGSGGGNVMGPERSAALGLVRRIEGRRALATLGVDNHWVLDGRDTPSQHVLFSLANWGHGAVLEEIVRLVRLTRPEVILTWLPRNVAGENHGDHQAAGVIATEAFDVAGDPTAFPAQISSMARPTEGLRPWWPKKLYYFTDAFSTEFFRGNGPAYSLLERSPARGVPYAHLALQEARLYASQLPGIIPPAAIEAIDRGDLDTAVKLVLSADPPVITEPLRLLLGRSRVEGNGTGDVFYGVTPEPLVSVPARAVPPAVRDGVSVELAGPWSFYVEFWRAHDLGRLADLGPPEMAVRPGHTLQVPLMLRNDSDTPVEVTLAPTLPEGWREQPRPARFPLAAHSTYEVQSFIDTPSQPSRVSQPLTYEARVGGRAVGSAVLRIQLRAETMPQ